MNTFERRLDKMIFEAALDLLREQEDPAPAKKKGEKKKDQNEGEPDTFPKSKIVIKGATGHGRWKDTIDVMESRAISEPKTLCQDLGLTRVSGNDLAQAYAILKTAITKNEVMKEAFESVSKTERAVDENKKYVTGLLVKSTLDKKRDAVKFLYITLLAADRARLVSFENGIGFSPYDFVKLPTIYPR